MSRDDWPAWATMPVEIVAADPGWPAVAARLRTRVAPLVASVAVGDVEHVGSTAVPHLAAKPIIDLLVLVDDVVAADGVAAALRADGWEEIPQELDGRPWRRAWVLPDGAVRLAHLHLVDRHHERAVDTVRFRDLLRADDELRAADARLKAELAVAHGDDREAYSDAKTAFVLAALAD